VNALAWFYPAFRCLTASRSVIGQRQLPVLFGRTTLCQAAGAFTTRLFLSFALACGRCLLQRPSICRAALKTRTADIDFEKLSGF
jgi:hypothetical protein